MSSRSLPMRSARARDRGESLIELLVSITILGVAASALLTGMGAAVTTSGYHTRQAQQVESVRNFVEAVVATSYVACAASYAPPGYGPTDTPRLAPAGYVLTANVTGYASGAGFSPSCPATDEGAQQVQIRITQVDSRVRDEQFTVVKRKPCTVLPVAPSYSC